MKGRGKRRKERMGKGEGERREQYEESESFLLTPWRVKKSEPAVHHLLRPAQAASFSKVTTLRPRDRFQAEEQTFLFVITFKLLTSLSQQVPRALPFGIKRSERETYHFQCHPTPKYATCGALPPRLIYANATCEDLSVIFLKLASSHHKPFELVSKACDWFGFCHPPNICNFCSVAILRAIADWSPRCLRCHSVLAHAHALGNASSINRILRVSLANDENRTHKTLLISAYKNI
jgi:hypothetical protein